MPFRFGIVTLTQCPHLFARVLLEVDGRQTWGISADVLANKWFTKDPLTSYEQDLSDMLKVIHAACDIAEAAGGHRSLFDLWESIYLAHQAWAGGWGFAPLLASFGASLVERAMIDAFCRDLGVPFSRALRENRLELRLGRIHEELSGAAPADLLPDAPLRQITVRHTVGLTDPLTDQEISEADRICDGLPQSLEACIRAYGLTHFKIKLWGEADRDLPRVRAIADVLRRHVCGPIHFTLDGNENFKHVDPFRAFWMTLANDPALSDFLRGLIFVEQPFHRSVALDANEMRAFASWSDRPPTIIDESDATIHSAREALSLGYAGVSHKNCKGVIKGIANACLIEHRRRLHPSVPLLQSAEDLTNIAPVALMQDTDVLANLGISHAERNGQHYFKGLSMFPRNVQQAVVAAHPDLYHWHENGYATLIINNGQMQTASILQNAFGVAADFNPEQFMPAREWTYKSLIGQPGEAGLQFGER